MAIERVAAEGAQRLRLAPSSRGVWAGGQPGSVFTREAAPLTCSLHTQESHPHNESSDDSTSTSITAALAALRGLLLPSQPPYPPDEALELHALDHPIQVTPHTLHTVKKDEETA
jgi:hypothetical protein